MSSILSALFGCCCGDFKAAPVLYKDWSSHPATRNYEVLERVGEGGFAEVLVAQDRKSLKKVALKVIFKAREGLTAQQRQILCGEGRLLKMLDHPGIVRCQYVYDSTYQQVLVLQCLSGGEMLDHLQEVDHYTEGEAGQLFKQVVEAVAYMHNLNIMHRDMKPENVMFAKPPIHYQSKGKPIKVKVIDLGMAGVYYPRRRTRGCMGSPGFIAPEVVRNEPHTLAMDIYSLGVVLFVMLVGKKPFKHDQVASLKYANMSIQDAPGLNDLRFKSISPAGQQLLLSMLADKPKARPTASQVLAHPWFKQQGVGAHRVIDDIVKRRFTKLAHLRRLHGTHRGLLAGHHNMADAEQFHLSCKELRKKCSTSETGIKGTREVAPHDPHHPGETTHLLEDIKSRSAPIRIKNNERAFSLPVPDLISEAEVAHIIERAMSAITGDKVLEMLMENSLELVADGSPPLEPDPLSPKFDAWQHRHVLYGAQENKPSAATLVFSRTNSTGRPAVVGSIPAEVPDILGTSLVDPLARATAVAVALQQAATGSPRHLNEILQSAGDSEELDTERVSQLMQQAVGAHPKMVEAILSRVASRCLSHSASGQFSLRASSRYASGELTASISRMVSMRNQHQGIASSVVEIAPEYTRAVTGGGGKTYMPHVSSALSGMATDPSVSGGMCRGSRGESFSSQLSRLGGSFTSTLSITQRGDGHSHRTSLEGGLTTAHHVMSCGHLPVTREAEGSHSRANKDHVDTTSQPVVVVRKRNTWEKEQRHGYVSPRDILVDTDNLAPEESASLVVEAARNDTLMRCLQPAVACLPGDLVDGEGWQAPPAASGGDQETTTPDLLDGVGHRRAAPREEVCKGHSEPCSDWAKELKGGRSGSPGGVHSAEPQVVQVGFTPGPQPTQLAFGASLGKGPSAQSSQGHVNKPPSLLPCRGLNHLAGTAESTSTLQPALQVTDARHRPQGPGPGGAPTTAPISVASPLCTHAPMVSAFQMYAGVDAFGSVGSTVGTSGMIFDLERSLTAQSGSVNMSLVS